MITSGVVFAFASSAPAPANGNPAKDTANAAMLRIDKPRRLRICLPDLDAEEPWSESTAWLNPWEHLTQPEKKRGAVESRHHPSGMDSEEGPIEPWAAAVDPTFNALATDQGAE